MEKLFHGSDKEIIKPIYGYGRNDCDYGSGFYLCKELDIARMWACQYSEGGYINSYVINMDKLNVLWLNHVTDKDILTWIALLCANRIDQQTKSNSKEEIDFLIKNFLPNLNGVDMIVGYRADDSYYQYTRAFLNNDLPLELLKEAMELGKLGLQYALISKKAFDEIRFIDSLFVPSSNEYQIVEETANKEYEQILRKRNVNQTYLRDIIREISKH